MTTFIQFRETPTPGLLFGLDAFAEIEGQPFILFVDGEPAGNARVHEVAVVEGGAAAWITFAPDRDLPPGELGARQVA